MSAQAQPKGQWIQTYTGKAFSLSNPKAADVDIQDIAHALSMLCRFTGHCTEFYSVAQHSVIVASVVAEEHPEWALAALLHDAAEAYLGDWSSPLKQYARQHASVNLHPQILDDVEFCVLHAIFEHFNLRCTEEAMHAIKAADLRALATERRDLMGHMWPKATVDDWFASSGAAPALPLRYTINPMSPKRAREYLRQAYLTYAGAR